MLTLSTPSWAQVRISQDPQAVTTAQNLNEVVLPEDISDLEKVSVVPPSEIKMVREKLVEGEECRSDLSFTSKALQTCQSDLVSNAPEFWQSPQFILAGYAISITGTLMIACFTHIFGMCPNL